MKKIHFILLLFSCLSLSLKSQVYINPEAKVEGDGSKLKPFKTLEHLKDNVTYFIKKGTTIRIKSIESNNVTLDAYGFGKLPIIDTSLNIIGQNISLNNLVFKDKLADQLVFITGKGYCTITNCRFISHSKCLVLESLNSATLINVKLYAKKDGLVARNIQYLDLYNIKMYDNIYGYSYHFFNIGEVKTYGISSNGLWVR